MTHYNLNLKEKTTDALIENTKIILLEDPIIRNLFDLICINNQCDRMPYNGNFGYFFEESTTNSVLNFWDEIKQDEDDCNNYSIKEITELFIQSLINELLEYLPDEYKINLPDCDN